MNGSTRPAAERRDLRTRALRDSLAARLGLHPRRLAGIRAELVEAMVDEVGYLDRLRLGRFDPDLGLLLSGPPRERA